jgi:steroid 5-alpha reductase family enzyme
MFETLVIQSVIITVYECLWFAAALKLRRNDVADIAWGAGFILLALAAQFAAEGVSARGLLVFTLVVLWGLRLSLHIARRNLGKGEDPRYRKWRQEWGAHAEVRAFFQVFLLQGYLTVIILIPATYVLAHAARRLTALDAFGFVIWLTGFIFESIGDLQLARFKRDANNRGRIITSGLWKYSRHPNYFGEVTLWWGIWLIACALPGGWKTIVGPMAISYLILCVSGIPLLEKRYEGNADFDKYRRRTSAFLPLPPKRQRS